MNGAGTPRPPPDPNVYYGEPIIPVGVATIVLTTLFVGMRFWSRAVILRALALEDGFMFLAWLFAVGTSSVSMAQLAYGLGRQYAVLDDETRTGNIKIGFATNLIYFFALLFVKVSVLCLYIRVLTYDYVRLAAKIMLGIVGITHLWIILSIVTSCVPLRALWDRGEDEEVYCHPGSVYWSHSGINISTDFLIALLPLTVLHKLHIPRRQKIALYCVFVLGFSVCIISLLRTLYFTGVHFIDVHNDTTGDSVVISIWTMLETNVGVICACIPTIKPVIMLFFPRFLASNPRSSDESSPWSDGAEQGRRRQYRQCEDDTVDVDMVTLGCKGSEQSSTETGSGSMPARLGVARMAGPSAGTHLD